MPVPQSRIDRSAETYRIPSPPTVNSTVRVWRDTGHLKPNAMFSILPGGGFSLVSDTAIADRATEQRFRQLASTWLRDTGYLSDPVRKFLDRSHLKIIAMGEKVLPLILRELEKKSGFWFVALDAISPENPVQPEDQVSFDATANAWLRWGRQRGLI